MNSNVNNEAPRLFKITLTSLLLTPTLASGTILFSEDFDSTDGAIRSLNGVAEDTAGAIWNTNGFATANGVFQVGQLEGSALLSFSPTIGEVYRLTLDVTSASTEWIGLGFSRLDTVADLNNNPNSRFSNSNRGIAWALYRPEEMTAITVGNPDGANDQIQIFGGQATGNGIADNNTDFSNGGLAVTRTLELILDTTTNAAAGGSLLNVLVDGVSVSDGFQGIGNDANAISGVGFTWEGPTNNNGTGTPITVDNFQLEVIPEPSTGILAVFGLLGLMRRRR